MDTQNFTRSVLDWYDRGHRDLPWRHTKDAYRIWISEIMLQQTRAETVISYYERFLYRYPTVRSLADAPQEELLKSWEGLGYYSRARSLQKAAQIIVSQYGGELPADVERLRALPGIGDYTAGAIASIAFGIPAAAVDGNVERVLCRYDAVTDTVGTPAVRRAIAARAQELVPRDRPGAFANAMMEMGATMCTPRSPKCLLCPVRAHCEAFAAGEAEDYPIAEAQPARPVEAFTVYLIVENGRVLVRKRPETGLLAGLWEFPHHLDGVRELPCEPLEVRHVFTHKIWQMRGVRAARTGPCGGVWVDRTRLAALPMNSAMEKYRQVLLESGELTDGGAD